MKNALKKAISVLLVAFMVFGSAPLAGFVGLDLPSIGNFFGIKARAATYSGTCGYSLIWTFNESTGELVINGTGDMYNWLYPSAPWYNYRLLIKSVTIPDSVTSIGDFAFAGCTGIASIKIPDSVTCIGDFAFLGCTSLANITIPDSVTNIGEYAFERCSGLASVTIGNRVTSIGDSAFSECNSLTRITIPDSVTSIGEFAFQDCPSLASVTIGNGVTSIGEYAFSLCGSLASITIPDSVTNIGDEAFWDCTSLVNVTIGNRVTSIGDNAFLGCTSLASITIPDSVTNIGDSVFRDCTSLVNVTIGNKVTSIGDNAFFGCTSLASITIPDSVTSIGDSAFWNCTSLASITIPDSVTRIDDSAFWNCDGLKDIYYGGSRMDWNGTSIGESNELLLNATIHFNHIHTVSLVKESADATCTENGYKTGICICGHILTEIVPALNHNIIIDEAEKATCMKTGLTEGQHCSRCDDMTVAQEVVPALNHKDTLVNVEAKAPTCTEIGWDDYEYCTACTYTTYEEKDALKHDIVIDKAVDATCTETGLTEGQHCSRCDDMTVAQEIVPVKPHNYTAKHDSTKHWKECTCGSIIDEQNHSFIGGNTCSCGFKRVVASAIKIKNNNGSKTINYGETLKLTANVTNKPSNAKIYWYVDGEKKGEGEVFNVKFESGAKIITVKLVDENGVVYQNASDAEITDSETVTVNGGFFQKLISFFKNLFGINRTIVQAFKVIY